MTGTPNKRARRERTQAFLSDAEQIDELLGYIAAGGRMHDYCKERDLVYTTVHGRITANDELMPRYQSAMDARSDLQREEIERLIDQVERGEMDAKAAAVAIAGRQWVAKVLNRRRYGDQQVVDVAVTDKTRLHIEALRLIARRPRKELPVIEAVFTPLPALTMAEAPPVSLVSRE